MTTKTMTTLTLSLHYKASLKVIGDGCMFLFLVSLKRNRFHCEGHQVANHQNPHWHVCPRGKTTVTHSHIKLTWPPRHSNFRPRASHTLGTPCVVKVVEKTGLSNNHLACLYALVVLVEWMWWAYNMNAPLWNNVTRFSTPWCLCSSAHTLSMAPHWTLSKSTNLFHKVW